MSTGGAAAFPDSVEKIYDEFVQRRCGSLRALTSDSDDFFKECDPEQENLCLYGNIDGTWTVGLPAEMVPAEVPEPAVGINFARDGMASRGLWLALGTRETHTYTYTQVERLIISRACVRACEERYIYIYMGKERVDSAAYEHCIHVYFPHCLIGCDPCERGIVILCVCDAD